MKPVLSLSTSWCSHRYDDGYAMLSAMAELGFTHVELSHGIRITLVPGILRAVEEGVVHVSSVHNFCPLPTGVMHAAPNLFEPSSRDPREHDQWVRHTRRTIEFAAQVRARVMVAHLGSVPFLWFRPGADLEKHAVGGDIDRPEYRKRLAKAKARLRKRMSPFWERTQSSLAELLGDAAEKGVRFGLENRERFEELPMDEDFPGFLGALPGGAAAGYWHDTGHAELKERLGLLQHREHLAALAPRLLGFHLHDVDAEGHDHQPVGSGQVDFRMVSSFWRPEHLLVLELSPRVPVEGVQSSRDRIRELIEA